MTAIAACACRIAASRPAPCPCPGPRPSLRALLGRRIGAPALLCRWSRVLGQLDETAAGQRRAGA